MPEQPNEAYLYQYRQNMLADIKELEALLGTPAQTGVKHLIPEVTLTQSVIPPRQFVEHALKQAGFNGDRLFTHTHRDDLAAEEFEQVQPLGGIVSAVKKLLGQQPAEPKPILWLPGAGS